MTKSEIFSSKQVFNNFKQDFYKDTNFTGVLNG